jgi:succinate dehydrogenase / fumarate reductase cytochrome b subunit
LIRREYWPFFLRRLHSLSGVFPIGAFLTEHMFTNFLASFGPETYNRQAEFLRSLPLLVAVEATFIWIPILFHALYGFYVMLSGRSNLSSYPFTTNWLYILQRVTGIVTFAFVLYHVYETRVATEWFGIEVNFDLMVRILNNPWVFWFYVVGLACVMFHFGNGLWGLLISWGIVTSPRGERVTSWMSLAVGVLFCVAGSCSL